MNNNIEAKLKDYPSVWVKFIVMALFLAIMVFLGKITLQFNEITELGVRLIRSALLGLVTPSTDLIFDLSSSGLLYMVVETFAIGFLGTIIGAILSIPLAFLCSHRTAPRWVNVIFITLVTVVRSFPTIMIAIMFVKTVGSGPFAGVLTMSIGSTGMITKMTMEAIEDLDNGVVEALDASGCNAFTKIRLGILPQLSAAMLSNILYRLDINVKNASILGLVGAGGIGATLIMAIEYRKWNDVGALLWGIVILVLLIELVSTKIRKSISSKD
ncbi:MAG: phosphonate ABC transporter, permease protein PhnE [Spirochaetales bacterium]|nr:phosphonate ABC transporter, permease protein PhnE [Candidatus Physcosoma equi]